MHAPHLAAAGVEAAPELGRERGAGELAVVDLGRESHEPGQVGLAGELALAELVRERVEHPGLLGEEPDTLGDPARVVALEQLQHPTGGLPLEKRRALEGDPGVVERLLEVRQSRVRPGKDGHLLERRPGVREALHLGRDPRVLLLGVGKGRTTGSGPGPRVARSTFSAPPRSGTRRFASSSTSGLER